MFDRVRRAVSDAVRFIQADRALWSRFARHDPWTTKFRIDGREYGGRYDAEHDHRLVQFARAFPVRESILEVGSLEGGHTFPLARLAGVKRVVGLEGRDFNIRKAELVKELLGVSSVEFRLADLEKDELASHGRFDVVFSLGLLYHLPCPWEHLRAVRAVTGGLFLWTHYVDDDKADIEREGYRGWSYGEHGHADPLSGLSDHSFWPTLEALKRMLADVGFQEIEIVELTPHHQHGPSVTLAARARVDGAAQGR